MKTIILVRHAQSGFESPTGHDIDRTLDSQGRKDAPEMAASLVRHKVAPDIFLSSPATRAVSTAAYFLKEFGKEPNELQVVEELYEPAVPGFYAAIEEIPSRYHTAVIFSHNPGITEFILDLGCKPAYTMPSGALYACSILADSWDEIRFAQKQFLFFESPK